MTEAEWLACADPTPMIEFVAGQTQRPQCEKGNRPIELCRRPIGLRKGSLGLRCANRFAHAGSPIPCSAPLGQADCDR